MLDSESLDDCFRHDDEYAATPYYAHSAALPSFDFSFGFAQDMAQGTAWVAPWV